MGKKSKKNTNTIADNKDNSTEFPEIVENKFKLILRSMSWIVGVCFILIIILPNFEFFLVDIIVKIIFYMGVLTLILFAILEMFGVSVKKYMNKYTS